MKTPLPDDIKRMRRQAGLTQTEAAALVYVDVRAWQYWEAGERNMPRAIWELFTLKTEQARLPRTSGT